MKKISIWTVLWLVTLTSCKDQSATYDATGTFEATEIIVSAEATGKLIHFDADEGKQLQKGEEVGLVDTTQLYLQKRKLLANMKSVEYQRPDIQKQIASIRERIEQAQSEKKRVENLLKSDAANQKQLDDWNTEIQVLNKQLEAQLSTLHNSTASLNEQSSSVAIQVAQVEDQLQKSRICAPIQGTVLAKYTEPGEYTAPGKPLFKIADTEHMFLRAYITSSQLSQVAIGQSVRLYADFGDDNRKEYPGKICWIADQAEFTPKTILTKDERANQVYAIKIAFRNDGSAKIGMYGEVKFTPDETTD